MVILCGAYILIRKVCVFAGITITVKTSVLINLFVSGIKENGLLVSRQCLIPADDRLVAVEVIADLTAFVLSLIEAEVYGKGIIMWLLSQGSSIEVVRPKEMREEFKRILMDMLTIYK